MRKCLGQYLEILRKRGWGIWLNSSTLSPDGDSRSRQWTVELMVELPALTVSLGPSTAARPPSDSDTLFFCDSNCHRMVTAAAGSGRSN